MPRILLVEDEKQAVIIIVKLLKSRDYEVTTAYTGKEALEHLQEEKFDVAIIDLILPDMNGNDICAMIRCDKRLKNLPVIISTGIADDSTQETSRNLGVKEFLSKPYSMEDLLSAIKRCLKK